MTARAGLQVRPILLGCGRIANCRSNSRPPMTTLLNRRQWLKAAGATLAATAVAPRLSRLEAAVAPTPPPTAPGLVQLSWNENPFGPSPAVQEAMRVAVGRTCRY